MKRATAHSSLLVVCLLSLLGACDSGARSDNVEPTATTALPFSTTEDSDSTSATHTSEPSDVTVTTFSPASFQGYGDFSGLNYHEVDWHDIVTRGVRCAQNHGYSVRLTYDGGVNYQDVPSDENAEAVKLFETCIRAMNAPEWTWPTEEEIRYKYAYALALIPCIRDAG